MSPVPVRVVAPATSAWTELRDLGTPVLAPLGRAGFVLVFTVFMLFKREDLRNRLLRLAGLGRLNVMTQALDDASGRVSRYLLMQVLVNAGFGTLFGAGLYLIGVPNPALWGAVAGILRIVPYVGTTIAATLPIALSLAVFDGWLRPLCVFLLVAGLELVIANFVEPWLYGARVGISSLALLVSAVFWTVLWGPAGLILSTPLTVCAWFWGATSPQLSFLHVLLGDEPVLAAEAQIYQRLLAMDQVEAHTIVGESFKGRPLVELYDSVLIPALSMAEQDRHKGAIDTAREEFLFLSINEMIVEFSEYQAGGSPLEDATRHPTARILCLPAHDRADEVTAAMLAQLLEQKGFPTLSLPIAGSSPGDWLASLKAGGGTTSSASRRCRRTRSRRRGPCSSRSGHGSRNSKWWFAFGDSAATRTKPRLVSSEINPIASPPASRRPWSMFRNSFAPSRRRHRWWRVRASRSCGAGWQPAAGW